MFLADTVIYRDCFRHHSEHLEGPQLDQEEMTTSGCSLVYSLAQGFGGAATTQTPILLPAKMLVARDEASGWGGEGKESISQKVCSHFPDTQCHQQKSPKARFSLGCTLKTRPWPAVWWKVSDCLSLFGIWENPAILWGAVFPPLPWWSEGVNCTLGTLKLKEQWTAPLCASPGKAKAPKTSKPPNFTDEQEKIRI